MGHEIAKKYVEKTPGGILPDTHVVVCSCEEFKEKGTSEAAVLERFEKHQQYPNITTRFF
jgi:hypothetical protein